MEVEQTDGLFDALGGDFGMGLFGQLIDVGDGRDGGELFGRNFPGA